MFVAFSGALMRASMRRAKAGASAAEAAIAPSRRIAIVLITNPF